MASVYAVRKLETTSDGVKSEPVPLIHDTLVDPVEKELP
jgi:hypothetical protein